MRINPVQSNFIQHKPQNTVNRPMLLNNGLQTDTVSFSGLFKKEKTESPKKTLKDVVPKHKGIIYKKVKDENGNIIKTPVEVDIIKRRDGYFDFEKDGKLLGGVTMRYSSKEDNKNYRSRICGDYKKEGIVGDRIIAEYIYNCKEEEYGGIGHLADLLEVAVCKELEIEPNVVSWSMPEAAPLHYKRGKRFVPFMRYNWLYYQKYGFKNPNDIVTEIIEKTPQGKDFDTSKINHCFLTYMPKEMIKELEEELKEHPIF